MPLAAEFRGPGVHHNWEDSDSGYELDADSGSKGKSFGVGGYRGRIIFLGDGTEVLTDSDDTEMFDNADEDKDLASQVSKASTATEQDTSKEGSGADKPSASSSDGASSPSKSKSEAEVEQERKPSSEQTEAGDEKTSQESKTD